LEGPVLLHVDGRQTPCAGNGNQGRWWMMQYNIMTNCHVFIVVKMTAHFIKCMNVFVQIANKVGN
jgi:hypothetical protein